MVETNNKKILLKVCLGNPKIQCQRCLNALKPVGHWGKNESTKTLRFLEK